MKDAHNIFETLNTRGVRITNGDLVTSHPIARATDATPEQSCGAVGVRNPDSHDDQRFPYHAAMLFLLSLIVKALTRLLLAARRDDGPRTWRSWSSGIKCGS